MQIPLSSPDITKKEIKAVTDVLSTPHLSLGPKLPEFEQALADYAGVKYAVAVNSGTSALHLIVRALGIGQGDEVITTPFSFIASANCILFEQAKPVFVDIDPRTMNIDASKIEEKITKNTKAILAVDVFGYPAEWAELEKLAKKHGLALIEDSCEALGAQYRRKKAGSFGNAGCFAFYPNKQITTGEGGVIVTNDKKISQLCKSMRNQGRDENAGWLQHQRLGYNYRLSDINCALGIAQMRRLDEILDKRERVAGMYHDRLRSLKGIELPPRSTDRIKRSWFVYVVKLSAGYKLKDRDFILKGLRRKGIGCNDYFSPIHLQPFYVEMFGFKKGDFPVTETVSQRTIALPFYNNLKAEQAGYVADTLKDLL
ncbi:MAG: DegT/DnrJ/EryC1/StrS family aminotransferase [Candidatus Margulisbacteria bacterium]|jgi:perosamine synthetase|nr:DegT/DnrJ/EryC1/StrS family aminotransferase [Candidatus Margulisiibacteriota bacterium]